MGVGVQLKTKYCPFITNTHFFAHRLNLAITVSIKKCEVFKKLREQLNPLYFFISFLRGNMLRLKQMQEVLGERELCVKQSYQIRWMGLKNAVEAVNES